MAKFDFYTQKPTKEEIVEFQTYYLTKPKLNLGCNKDIRKDYLNIDILDCFNDDGEGIDLIIDLALIHNIIPKNSAKEILVYDVLEHFPFQVTRQLLKNWVSLLKPEGKIIVRVPDLYRLSDALRSGKLPIFQVQKLIYGGQDYEFNYHMAGFTGELLEGYLLGTGCKETVQVVKEDNSYNVTIVATK